MPIQRTILHRIRLTVLDAAGEPTGAHYVWDGMRPTQLSMEPEQYGATGLLLKPQIQPGPDGTDAQPRYDGTLANIPDNAARWLADHTGDLMLEGWAPVTDTTWVKLTLPRLTDMAITTRQLATGATTTWLTGQARAGAEGTIRSMQITEDQPPSANNA